MATNELNTMTWDRWQSLSQADKDRLRDLSDLSPQLRGLEGRRVEVVDIGETEPRRFRVGKSTGWKPVHLELHNIRSRGGSPAQKRYASVRVVRSY